MNTMAILQRLSRIALPVAAVMTLPGCVEALLVSGVATGVVVATDRRQAEVMFADQRKIGRAHV